jgi:hypothetical protein
MNKNEQAQDSKIFWKGLAQKPDKMYSTDNIDIQKI